MTPDTEPLANDPRIASYYITLFAEGRGNVKKNAPLVRVYVNVEGLPIRNPNLLKQNPAVKELGDRLVQKISEITEGKLTPTIEFGFERSGNRGFSGPHIEITFPAEQRNMLSEYQEKIRETLGTKKDKPRIRKQRPDATSSPTAQR